MYVCYKFQIINVASFRQTLQKERQAREAAEKEKNELLERLNRLEEEAIKAKDGIYP